MEPGDLLEIVFDATGFRVALNPGGGGIPSDAYRTPSGTDYYRTPDDLDYYASP